MVVVDYYYFCFVLSTHGKIGFLLPLNDKFEEDTSKPQLPIFQGPNFVGRSCIPVADKRLSRKHLTITASGDDGSADVVVV